MWPSSCSTQRQARGLIWLQRHDYCRLIGHSSEDHFHKNQMRGAYAHEHIAETPEADQPQPGTRNSEE